jgi:hypothetical protein
MDDCQTNRPHKIEKSNTIAYQKSQSFLKIFGEKFGKKISFFFPSVNSTNFVKFLEGFGYHKIDPQKKTCIVLICGFHFCGNFMETFPILNCLWLVGLNLW